MPIGPCAAPAGQDSGQRLVPLGSFRRRRSELIRELKRAPKVGSEVRASVADCCSSLCTILYRAYIEKGRNSAVNEDSSAF